MLNSNMLLRKQRGTAIDKIVKAKKKTYNLKSLSMFIAFRGKQKLHK